MALTESDFNKLYRDNDFSQSIDGIANRYYRAYASAFESMAYDVDDIKQELWFCVLESDTNKKSLLMNRVIDRVHNMLRDSGRELRSRDNIDIESYALEDESGNIEGHDETMERLVYHGRARYVG